MAKKPATSARAAKRNASAKSNAGSESNGGPQASRPYVPGYGIPTEAKGMLPWSFAEERLAKAMNYWVCTTTPDGKPHARPVWALWFEGVLCFGGHGVRWDKNLFANPNVSVHLESGDEVVILEGAVERFDDDKSSFARRSADAAKKKYGMGGGGAFWTLRPRRAFGWTLKSQFKDATRWHFENPEKGK